MTKAMLARCQNELKQAFCAMPEDVQRAMLDHEHYAERLVFFHYSREEGAKWLRDDAKILHHQDRVFRLSPDTPCEPEYDERNIVADLNGVYRLVGDGIYQGYTISHALSLRGFAGFLYRDADGTETWRTTIDCAFGTPVKVRFIKEVTK